MPDQQSSPSEQRTIESIVPVLRVSDLATSLRFYIETLGFTKDWGADADNPGIASVSRDGQAMMLSQGERGGSESWMWVGVEDVVPLYEEFVEKGVAILQLPTNRAWALEIKIRDPDGHVLWLGSEPLANEPLVS